MLKSEIDYIDYGEAEAIALAKEVHAELILLDDRAARQMAKSLRLDVLGTIGLLIRARQIGKIASLRVILDKLRKEAHFRISDQLYDLALKIVGEVV